MGDTITIFVIGSEPLRREVEGAGLPFTVAFFGSASAAAGFVGPDVAGAVAEVAAGTSLESLVQLGRRVPVVCVPRGEGVTELIRACRSRNLRVVADVQKDALLAALGRQVSQEADGGGRNGAERRAATLVGTGGRDVAGPAVRRQRVYAVLSFKGGVGKTTIALNLAGLLAMHHGGARVVVVDLDRYDKLTAILQVAPGDAVRVNDIMEAGGGWRHPLGFDVVSGALDREWHAAVEDGHVRQLVDYLRGRYDLLVFDLGDQMPAGADVVLAAATDVWVVGTPDLATLRIHHSRRAELREKVPTGNLGMVINRYRRDAGVAASDVSDAMPEVPVLGVLPEDAAVGRAANARQLVVKAYPKAPFSVELKSLVMPGLAAGRARRWPRVFHARAAGA